MRLDDLNEVNKLVKVKEKLEKAIAQCDKFWGEAKEVDSGGTPGFDTGYGTHMSSYSDSSYSDSSSGVNMSGCYVGVQMAKATMGVLQLQHSLVLCRLGKLNIILEEK